MPPNDTCGRVSSQALCEKAVFPATLIVAVLADVQQKQIQVQLGACFVSA
jgi:hypothetical protein